MPAACSSAPRRPPVREGGPSISADTSQFVLHHSTASPLVRGVYEVLTTRKYEITHTFLAVKIENSPNVTHSNLICSCFCMKKKNWKTHSTIRVIISTIFLRISIIIHHRQNVISHQTQTWDSCPQMIVCRLNDTLTVLTNIGKSMIKA